MLDSFTILVAGTAALMLLGATFFLLWLNDFRSSWLAWWGVPLFLNGISLLLYLRPAWETDWLSIVVGNAVRIIGLFCLWCGIRAFEGKHVPWKTGVVLAVIWFGLCLTPQFIDSMPARIATVSLMHAAVSALIVADLWQNHSEGLRSRFPLIAVFASYSVFMIVRTGVSETAPFPFGAAALDPTWMGVYSVMSIAHAMLAGFLFLSMTLERREAMQRGFAMSDPLTGLLNRRAFDDFALRMSRRRAAPSDPMGLLVLDIDHFKQVNDRYGHEAGDRMLKAFAEVAEEHARATDQLFRMGGEEFCFVFPDTTLEETLEIAERVRRSFEGLVVDTLEGAASTTVSVGLAVTHQAVEMGVLLAAADAAVYEAKARGRNRVVIADPSTVLQTVPRSGARRRVA